MHSSLASSSHTRTLLLALSLLLALGLVACSTPGINPVTSPSQTPTPAPTKALGAFFPLTGTDYLVAPIVQEAVARGSSGFSLSSSPGYTPASIHNLIFLNQRDETIRQLGLYAT